MKKGILVLLVTICAVALVALGSSVTYALMAKPTLVPTAVPMARSTAIPTVAPTTRPSVNPTVIPTAIPSASPIDVPTASPTIVATPVPTAVPTAMPSNTVVPTVVPTATAVPPAMATPTVIPKATAAPLGGASGSAKTDEQYYSWARQILLDVMTSVRRYSTFMGNKTDVQNRAWRESVRVEFIFWLLKSNEAEKVVPPSRFTVAHGHLLSCLRHLARSGNLMDAEFIRGEAPSWEALAEMGLSDQEWGTVSAMLDAYRR